MARILSLETSTKVCSIALHDDGKLVADQTYHLEKSHSSLLPHIAKELLANCEIELSSVDAFAVSSGPGSYTGLRIGVTTAKGLAYASNKPLISVSTLHAMLHQVQKVHPENAYFCPMIDARRMEVYCLLADHGKQEWEISPLIVESNSFEEFTEKPLYLFGDGAMKTKEVLTQDNLIWLPNIHTSAKEIGELAEEKFLKSEFEDVAYFEPFYLKEFQTKPAKKLV
jgi:tRNA threonylcarbamoyladenosine biosynthesis protein TsaB